MLKNARSYEEACRTFRWRIPERYNLAFDACDRQTMAGADGHRTALIVEAADGAVERFSFLRLRHLSNRLAERLAAAGVARGDRVLISFPPGAEAAVAVLAVTKMGAIAVPVPVRLGSVPMRTRILDCGAKAALAVPEVLAGLPDDLFKLGGDLWAVIERGADGFPPAVTGADEPALLFYSFDGEGEPKGALHGHRVLPGNLPAIELALGFFAQPGDVFWTSHDWMEMEGLVWGVLAAWHHGVPVVAGAGRFVAERALGLMARHGVRAAFLASHHLGPLVRAAADRPHPLLRAMACTPTAVSAEDQARIERVFGVTANEVWGTLETGAVAAHCPAVMERREGSVGRMAPGVTVETVMDGHTQPAGQRGQLAAAPKTPGAMLGLWGEPVGSSHTLMGWTPSGRMGVRDLDGYVWADDDRPEADTAVVDGVRVSLTGIEAALEAHGDVAEAGVIAVGAGEIRAYVGLKYGRAADAGLAKALIEWVRARRGEFEVPRRLEFVEALPRGPGGKINRDELARRPVRLDSPLADERPGWPYGH